MSARLKIPSVKCARRSKNCLHISSAQPNYLKINSFLVKLERVHTHARAPSIGCYRARPLQRAILSGDSNSVLRSYWLFAFRFLSTHLLLSLSLSFSRSLFLFSPLFIHSTHYLLSVHRLRGLLRNDFAHQSYSVTNVDYSMQKKSDRNST